MAKLNPVLQTVQAEISRVLLSYSPRNRPTSGLQRRSYTAYWLISPAVFCEPYLSSAAPSPAAAGKPMKTPSLLLTRKQVPFSRGVRVNEMIRRVHAKPRGGLSYLVPSP